MSIKFTPWQSGSEPHLFPFSSEICNAGQFLRRMLPRLGCPKRLDEERNWKLVARFPSNSSGQIIATKQPRSP